jgi:hypothetical protein
LGDVREKTTMSVRATLSSQPVVYLNFGGHDGGLTPGTPYAETPQPAAVAKKNATDKLFLGFQYGTRREIQVGVDTFTARDAVGAKYLAGAPSYPAVPAETASRQDIDVEIDHKLQLSVAYDGHHDIGSAIKAVSSERSPLEIARDLVAGSDARFISGFQHHERRSIVHDGIEYVGKPAVKTRFLIGESVPAEEILAGCKTVFERDVITFNYKIEDGDRFVKFATGRFDKVRPGDVVLSLADIAAGVLPASAAAALRV